MSDEFRTCKITGLKVHLPAEQLIKINAVSAVVSLLIGGILALLVILTRWPTTHLLDFKAYYQALTAHPLNMLVFWIVFFEIALLYFTGAVLLNARLAAPRLGWIAYILMVAGALLLEYTVLIVGNENIVMFTSYPPLKASPLFYLGYILFAVGALIGVCLFFATLYNAKREGTYKGSLPLVTYGAAAAAILAVETLLFGAITFLPTFFWSIGMYTSIDPQMYRLLFWGFGHSTQQINVAAMVATWYALVALTVGGKSVSEKFSRSAFMLYILFINVASEHHLLWDPGLTPAHKVWNTSYIMGLAVLASLMHAYAIPAAIEAALRRKGFNKGLFDWLRNAPWGNPGFSALVFSVIGFGFLGGLTGLIVGTEQLSLRTHNTWSIPGHFHGTVVSGTTLAFMGITYYVIPLIFRREIAFPGLAKLQPYIFALGIYALSFFMMAAGVYGVPRRHWDIVGFGGSPFAFDFDPTAMFFVTLAAIGGIIAVIGGAIFVLIAVVSVFFGKRME